MGAACCAHIGKIQRLEPARPDSKNPVTTPFI